MRRTFIEYIVFLIYVEVLFHLACFKSLSLSSTIFILFVSIIIAGFLTIISSISKREKINTIIMRVFLCVIALAFSAELVYFSIYESFFSFNGIQFVGALKDGYDKVLLTIFQNIICIGLLIGPTIYFVIKMPKVAKYNRSDLVIIILFMIISSLYSIVSVEFIDKEKDNSLYNLIHMKNLPIQNVKKMGLMASTSLSLERKIFGFNQNLKPDEDILVNKRTILMDKVDTKYNIDTKYGDSIYSCLLIFPNNINDDYIITSTFNTSKNNEDSATKIYSPIFLLFQLSFLF